MVTFYFFDGYLSMILFLIEGDSCDIALTDSIVCINLKAGDAAFFLMP